MARIRTIKPDFFTSEDIVSLSPLARLLFISTWLEADREGRFVWRPKNLKLRYLPGDDCDIYALTDELLDAGLVVTYGVNGQTYAEIPSFPRHQVINNRESVSNIPARVTDALTTREARVTDASMTQPLRPLREGKGKERKVYSTRRVHDEQAGNGFDLFWEQYPVKKGKQDALKAWRKLKPSGDLLDTIMAALKAQKASPDWQKDGGKYIQHPATWLNGCRWEDEVSTSQPPPEAGQSNIFAGAI